MEDYNKKLGSCVNKTAVILFFEAIILLAKV